MALLKIVPNTYKSYEDLYNLFQYLVREDKNPLINSDLRPISLDNKALEIMALQWCYAHKMYQPDKDRTMCYHYVVSFDLTTNAEYNILYEKSKELLCEVSRIPLFTNLHYFACAHRRSDNIPEHIHIIIDSLDHRNGHATYIPYEKLKDEIGEALWYYNMALAGYSYETHGRLRLGKASPRDLYEEKWY